MLNSICQKRTHCLLTLHRLSHTLKRNPVSYSAVPIIADIWGVLGYRLTDTKLRIHNALCTGSIDAGSFNGVTLLVFNADKPFRDPFERLLLKSHADTAISFGLKPT